MPARAGTVDGGGSSGSASFLFSGGVDAEARDRAGMECTVQAPIVTVDVVAELHRAVGVDPCRPVQDVHRDALGQGDPAILPVRDQGVQMLERALRAAAEQVGRQLERPLDAKTAMAEVALPGVGQVTGGGGVKG